METVLVILVLISFGAMIVGLIQPSAVRVPTRGKALGIYGVTTLALFIAFAFVADPVETDATGSSGQGGKANAVAASPQAEENQVNSSDRVVSGSPALATYRKRANSDDAQSVEEAFAHAEAHASVIRNVQPNNLGIGGREFRVKRNPVGSGSFVYDPRTRFSGVERLLVWWVPEEGKVYPLNSPSKMVTPQLRWPREDGVDAPSTAVVVDYVFHGKPMSLPERRDSRSEITNTFTVEEYRVYRAVIDTPMSVAEQQALQSVAERYGITAGEARKTVDKVQQALYRNSWTGSPDAEIQHASDWQGERP